MIYTWTLTLVYVGWCYGGYHGDAVHVEAASLDRNCRRACAEIYTGHQFQRRRTGKRERKSTAGPKPGAGGVRIVPDRREAVKNEPEVADELVFFMVVHRLRRDR